MQVLAAVHDTEASVSFEAPAGRASASVVQAVPFQDAAIDPTARHEVTAVQDTPVSGGYSRIAVAEFPMAPRGLAVAWMAHAGPCCASVSVCRTPGLA